jgi:glycosyltransferase involved in cell wall biosynthesis
MSDVDQDCLVSVVLPAYNAREFIAVTIESVLQQTERRLELIVVNDCSTDDTAEIVALYAARDQRIQLLHMPQNSGPAAARNVGFDVARGRWIALLDSDDRYARQRLARLIELAEANAADMVSDNLVMEPIDGPPYLLIPPAILPDCKHLSGAEFVLGNIGDRKNPRLSYGFMQPMLRRDFLLRHNLRHDERNRFGEDFMLYIACLHAGARWWITPEAFYHYTIRPRSLTEVQSSSDLLRIAQLEAALLNDPKVAEDLPFLDALRRHKMKMDRAYYYRAFTDAIKQQQFERATSLLIDSRRSASYIVQEAFRQAPTIMQKFMRGGYALKADRLIEAPSYTTSL